MLGMTKVAYVIRPAEGGMRKHLLELLRYLDRELFLPIVLSPPGNDLVAPLAALNVEHIEVDIADKPNVVRDAGSVARLATSLTAIRPDLIHVHSNKAALLVEMAVRRASAPAPVIFSMHNFPSYISAGGFRKTAASIAMRRIVKQANRLIVVSESLKSFLVDKEKAEPAKITVIHNGLDYDGFRRDLVATNTAALRSSLNIAEGAPVIGTVGRFVHSKGQEYLIAAAPELIHKYPLLKIVIVGAGPLEHKLKGQAAALGLSGSVIFTGFIKNLAPYYAMFDVFILPTLMESFGLTVLEAMAADCPVIASRTGGIPEILENRSSGLLVPPGDALSIAKAARTLLTDGKAARRMAEEAKKTVQARFTLEKMVRETQQVYEHALIPR